MKKFFLSFAIFVLALGVEAQTNQYFWNDGKFMFGVQLAQTDSITFRDSIDVDTMNLLISRAAAILKKDTMYIVVHDTIYVNRCQDNNSNIDGTLNGLFSVSETTKVRFSQGNLQFNAAQGEHVTIDGKILAGTWRFAANQYDTIGGANSNISATYNGWVDFFPWGSSGYDNTANDPYAVNYQPWYIKNVNSIGKTSTECNMYNYYGNGPSTNMRDKDLKGTSANYDWGIYNAISNGGDQPGMWRTLSSKEWLYLFHERANADKLFGLGSVNGINGVIILPDNWNLPSNLTFVASSTNGMSWSPYNSYYNNRYCQFTDPDGNYFDNTYTVAEWEEMENAGAVFLPAAGYLDNKKNNHRESGWYWSTSCYSSRLAFILYFGYYYGNYKLTPQDDYFRNIGCSVRLVR